MAKGFDGLIEYLLEEVALCGEIGTLFSSRSQNFSRQGVFAQEERIS